jgi:hypothetical protein
VTFEARRRPGFGKRLQVKNILKEIDLANEHYSQRAHPVLCGHSQGTSVVAGGDG